MNIKKLEKEFFEKDCICGELAFSCNLHREWWLKQLIKQVVESVPVEEKSRTFLDEECEFCGRKFCGAGYEKTCSERKAYNQHVKEIKNWKKKILEEIEKRDRKNN